MNKKKLLSLFTVAAILGALSIPTKKAEAGVILSSPLLGLAGIAVGGTGLFLQVFNEQANDESLTLREQIAPLKKYLIASMAIFILDSNEQNNSFDTVPSYLIQEIKDQAAIKGELIEANQDGIKEVIFNHDEIDEIFELADESTSLEQLDNLRDLLTTKSIQ